LNILSGRSFNDPTHYPVFPWVIADYVSQTLDLSNPKVYRDLSRPMAMQRGEDSKLAMLIKRRYEQLGEAQETQFHYGVLYSSLGCVYWNLMRLAPITHSALQLGRGYLGFPERHFTSVPGMWNRNSGKSLSDIKELVPEFYYLPDFLLNLNDIPLGFNLPDGSAVHHVALPPWAKTAADYVSKNREALESKYVSEHINEWIDLIFGFKQRGKAAEDATNLYYILVYEDLVDINGIMDPVAQKATEEQSISFGAIPKQLFVTPHPKRNLPKEMPKPIGENPLNIPIISPNQPVN